MRLLAVLHTPRSPHSAVFLSCERLREWLAPRGHRLEILTPDDLPRARRVHARWLPLVYPPLVAAWLSRHGGDLDVVLFHSYAGWADMLRARRRYAVITSFHGLEPLYFRELAREARRQNRPLRLPFRALHGALIPRLLAASCRHSDAVFCLNQTEARFLREAGWGETVVTLGHGIDDEWFAPRAYRAAARELLFVGQWLPMKGVTDLVEAFGRLVARWPEVRLSCVGTLADPATVLGSFPEALQSRVMVHPRADRSDLRQYYEKADVFVFPSLSEGFSSALLEAMATGLPIVATPVGAAPELLESGRSCLTAPTRDPAALVEALATLLRDQALRERLGRAAQDRARLYSSDRMHAAVLAAIEAVAPRT